MAAERVPPLQQGVKHDVQVEDDGKVNKPELDAHRGDQVVWKSYKPARIVFESTEGSPFEHKTFVVSPEGTQPAAQVKDDVEARRYKYTVYGAHGTNDPAVIIHN